MDKNKSRKNQKVLLQSLGKLGDKKALLRQYSSQLDEYKKALEEYSRKLKSRANKIQLQEKTLGRSPIVIHKNKNTMQEVNNSKNYGNSGIKKLENPQVEILNVESYPVDSNLLWGFHIDSPKKGDKINSYVIKIIGWVLGRKAPALTLEIVSGARVMKQISIRKQRPGVAKHYPDLPKAKTCGFAAELGIIGLPQDTESELILRVVLQDKTIIPIAAIELRYKPQKTLGVLYIAIGKKYIDEAQISAASLKAKMPHIPVTIFANEEVKTPEFDESVVLNQPYYSNQDKVVHLYDSPYEHTLFLDTDTYICDDFSELFDILENFDLATVHAPTKIPGTVNGVPECYQQMNTGVILFKKSPEVKKLCEDWVKIYEPGKQDQPSFREALFKSNLRVATLTTEYNCRFPFPIFVSGTVKILHGRHPDLAWVDRKINSEKGSRVYRSKDFKL